MTLFLKYGSHKLTWKRWMDKGIVNVKQLLVGHHIKSFSEKCAEFGLPKLAEWKHMQLHQVSANQFGPEALDVANATDILIFAFKSVSFPHPCANTLSMNVYCQIKNLIKTLPSPCTVKKQNYDLSIQITEPQ